MSCNFCHKELTKKKKLAQLIYNACNGQNKISVKSVEKTEKKCPDPT
jgi:hypothetical protein